MTKPEPMSCVACDRGADEAPLISFQFRGATRWICPQHLPLLIHDPGKLAGKLPGAERLEGSGHHD